MKPLLYILLGIFVVTCKSPSTKFENEGELLLKNGEGAEVPVKYQITDFDKFVKYYTKDQFDTIVSISTEEAKYRCKYPLTYIPNDIILFMTNDTLVTKMSFTASNAFGVPDKLSAFSRFNGMVLIETF
jgi:hypothetical protein